MSDGIRELPPNVVTFMNYCAREVGKFKEDLFHINTYDVIKGYEIQSPIEQLLYCAMITLQKINFINDVDPIDVKGSYYLNGLDIIPQYEIDNYRVDFLVQFWRHIYNTNENISKDVIVECDSQMFHDRTEKERRYEKIRDRYLIQKGYKVFHYTGKEIIDAPFKVAAEILAYVTESSIEHMSIDANMA